MCKHVSKMETFMELHVTYRKQVKHVYVHVHVTEEGCGYMYEHDVWREGGREREGKVYMYTSCSPHVFNNSHIHTLCH